MLIKFTSKFYKAYIIQHFVGGVFCETTSDSDEVPSARAISINVFSMIPVLLLGTKQSSKL